MYLDLNKVFLQKENTMDKFNIPAFVHDEIKTIKEETIKTIDKFLGIVLIEFVRKIIPILEELETNPKDIAIFKKWVKNSTK